MKKRKFKQQNQVKTRHHCRWLIGAVMALLFLAYVITITESHAVVPNFAQIIQLSGERLLFRQGSRRPEKARRGQRLRNNNEVLIVPGNNKSWIHLALMTTKNGFVGMKVQAGPDVAETEYVFPCMVQGGLVIIGWRRGSERGCEEEGILLRPRPGEKVKVLNTRTTISPQAGKNLQKAQEADEELAPDEVIIKPNDSEQTVIQAGDSETVKLTESLPQQVSVFIGTVNVVSTQYPEGEVLEKGQRYTYEGDGKGTIDNIDLDEKIKSPEFQNFLNPNKWSSPDLTDEVTDKIEAQLIEHRQKLGLSIAAWMYPPSEGAQCACIYPPDSERRRGEQQQVVSGIWELRLYFALGKTRNRFVCNVKKEEFSSSQGGIRLERQKCQRPEP